MDASAMIAILTRETQADDFVDALQQAHSPITSAIAVFETVLGICRKRHASVDEAGAPLLFKGNDFTLTDIQSAVP